MLHLQLLGPLLVQDDDGKDVTPPGARERDGLVTLAVVSPDPLSTERIAAELYRERDTTDPRNAVQAMISRLRRGLGRAAGAVETTTNGYRLVDVELDVDEAERLLRATIAESDLDAASELLEQAAARWHGPTLDGLSGELIETERLRIDELRADAEDSVYERRLLAGADQGLIEALEAAVRDQPLREKRWELLMRSLYRDGRQADALRAFQRARSLLSNHLGLEPGPALARLEQQILSHDPALAGGPPPATLDGGVDAGVDGGHGTERRPDGVEGDGGLPRGTVSVLLCDVEGSVKRWEADPDHTAREIAALHEIWSDATESHRGFLVKSTGDGVLAVFGTAGAAVHAAAAAMRRHGELSLQVKVAIHTGSLEPVAGSDYRGPVVNRCARLLDLAAGGQILASGATAELAKPELGSMVAPAELGSMVAPPELGSVDDRSGSVSLRDLGMQWLRDVPEPIAVWQVDGPGVRASFPPLDSRGPISLPRLRSGLLGRAELVEEVKTKVGDQKLVTLLGPGGIGKTSLALAVAWEIAGSRPLTFVDLARVSDPAAVEHRMVDAIVTSDHDGDQPPMDRIADRLRANTDLVVIDNAEHVLDAVAATVDHVLQYELKGSFLVTTRHPLGLPDETIIGVPPLELPADGDDLGATGRSPSVKLFIERARAIRPDFEIPNGLLPVVAHICRRLDGIPLAIELAAGRASLLSIDDIAARLDDQLRLLRQVRSSRDRRHQSLEAVVGWSVDQLSADAREVFDRLSIMAGGFGIDGAETMLHHCDLGSIDVLQALDELYGASLLTVEPEGSRFRMLEPIRQIAAAELAQRDLEPETRTAHARWLIDLVIDAHTRRDETKAAALDKIDDEGDQLRAVIAWIAEAGRADLATEIAFPCAWWFLTRDTRSGERLLGKLLPLVDRATDPLGWANVVVGMGIVTVANPWPDVVDGAVEAVEIFDQHDHPDRNVARLAAAFALTANGDSKVPGRLLEEAEALTSSDDRWAMALVDMAQTTMQSLLMMMDPSAIDAEPLITRGRRAVSTLRAFREVWALGATLGELGRLYQSLGRLDEAEACYVESLELFSDSDYHGSHYVYSELGRLATRKGEHILAEQYHFEAMQIAEADGNRSCIAITLAGMGHAAEARNELQVALDFYQQASSMSDQASLIEHGHGQWLEAIARLRPLLESQDG
ncbi:MAG: BTAD domain-containing putative transcriptional regulator [Acidimicrobiales bacterium]